MSLPVKAPLVRSFLFSLPLLTLCACSSNNDEVAADAGADGARAPADRLVIPFVVSQSGTLASEGAEQRRGATVAMQQLNAIGGILGRPLAIEFLDDKSDPNEAARLVGAFAGAPLVLGPTGSPAAVALRAAAPTQLFVSPSATTPVLDRVVDGGVGGESMFFRTTPSDTLQAKGIALMAALGLRGQNPCLEMSIVYSEDDYGTPIANRVKQLYSTSRAINQMLPIPGTPRDPEYYDGIAASVLGVVNDAANECQLVVAPGAVAAEYMRGFHRAKQASQKDLGAFRTFGSDALRTEEFLRASRQDPNDPASPSLAENVQIVAPESAPEGLSYSAYQSLYRAQFPNEPIGRSANAYDAVIVAALALQAANGSAEPAVVRAALLDVSKLGTAYGPGKLVDGLLDLLRGNDIDYVGASGSLDFSSQGQVLSDMVVWRVQNGAFAPVGRYTRSEVQD